MKISLWARTTVMGIMGGILFGATIQFWMGNMVDVGALYGSHSVIWGWVAHLFHSVVGAIILAGIVRHTPLRKYATKPSGKVVVGLVYGFVLWVVFIGVVLPIWLDVMTQWGGGIPLQDSDLRFPASLIGFSLYGLVVSGGIQLAPPAVEEKESESRTSDGDRELHANSDFSKDIDS